jgi:hypothetical protein
MMQSPLAMYRDGRFGMREAAWDLLMSWGELDEGTPRWEEAYAVARETMTRARQNVERIIAFLQEHGYIFGFSRRSGAEAAATGFPVWQPRTPESDVLLARLTAEVGPLPLSLRAWYEIVGTVSLRGAFPEDWDGYDGLPMNDPLMVAPLNLVLEELNEFRQSIDHAQQNGDQRLLDMDYYKLPGSPLFICPDIYIKANISGGSPYEIRAPDRRADAPLLNVETLLPTPPGSPVPYQHMPVYETFVGYLRRSLQWAGFPGYALGPQPGFERIRPLFAQMLPI